MKDKIRVEISGEKKNLYSSRQITQIIDAISEKHYKNELVHEIIALNNIKNIVIMDESAKINHKYKDIDDEPFIIDSKSLLSIYHKGKLSSIIVDINLMLMSETFKIFRELYQNYNEHNEKMSIQIKEEMLFNLYSIIRTRRFTSNELDEFLQKYTSYTPRKIKSIKNKLNKTVNLYKKHKAYKYVYYIGSNKDEYRDVIKLENEFSESFRRLSKPILYVQFDDNRWKMLGVKMIKEEHFQHSNSQFLDINTIKQESPLFIAISVSALFLPVLIELSIALCDYRVKKKNYQENVNKLSDIIQITEKNYDNPDLTFLEIQNLERETDKKINELPNELKSKIRDIKKELIEGNNYAFKENDISIDYVNIDEK